MRAAILPLLRALPIHPSLVFDDTESELRLEHYRNPLTEALPSAHCYHTLPQADPLSSSLNDLDHSASQSGDAVHQQPKDILADIVQSQRKLESLLNVNLDPWRSSRDASASAFATLYDHASQRDLILLRNELLYERYLRQQYFTQYVEQMRGSLETQSQHSQLQQAQMQIEQLCNKVSMLQRLSDERATQFQEMESRHHQSHDELHHHLHLIKKEKQHLHDQLKKAQTFSTEQSKAIVLLQDEITELTKKNAELQLQLITPSSLEPLISPTTVSSSTMSTETTAAPPLTHLDAVDLDVKLAQAETLIASQEGRIRALEGELDEIQKKLTLEQDVIGKLIEEKESLQDQHQHLLQESQIVSDSLTAKLNISDNRYTTAKNINLHLQRRIMDLSIQLSHSNDK